MTQLLTRVFERLPRIFYDYIDACYVTFQFSYSKVSLIDYVIVIIINNKFEVYVEIAR